MASKHAQDIIPAPSESSPTARGFLILASLVCLLTLLVFFREFFWSHFRLIAGDGGDNRFYLAILEHWRAVIRGQASFTSPNFFWPEHGVLGYGDSMFLLSLPYIVAGFFGLDHYVAFELALMVFKAIGFFSMLWLLRSAADVSRPVAVLGAVLFTLSNLYFISMVHAQLATVAFTPLVAALACLTWREYGSGRVWLARRYGVACAVLIALVLFTSFYIGWFTILAGAGCIVIAMLVRGLQQKSASPLSESLQTVFARRQLLIVAAIVFAVAMIPFVVTYGHALSHSAARTFKANVPYSAAPADVLNVGTENWMWGRLLKSDPGVPEKQPDAASDKRMGWPPLILLLVIGGGLVSFIKLKADRWRIVVLSASWLLFWVLSVHLGSWSLWWLVFKLVPGSSPLHIPVQLNLVLNVLLVAAACLVLEQFGYRRHGLPRAVCAGLAVLLIAEQMNFAPTHAINRVAENAFFARIQQPPAGCSSFFFTAPAQAKRPYYANQIDAMLVARAVNLPTINGYSSRFPLHWNLLMFNSAYFDHAREWALRNQLQQGLCGLDLRNGSWTTNVDVRDTYPPGRILDFRSDGNAVPFEGEGWGYPEPGGSWTIGGNSVLVLKLPAPPVSDLLLSFDAHAFTPSQRSRFDETLMVNGREIDRWSVTDHEPLIQRQVRLPLELIRSGVVRVEFINQDPRSPADLGISMDKRKIGLMLEAARLDTTIYPLGEVVDFRKGGNAVPFKTDGWGNPEPLGSWTIGARSVLVLPLPAPPSSDLLLSFEAHAFTPTQRSHFDETLMVNGHAAAQWPITDQESLIRRRVQVPAEQVQSGVVRLEFINHDPRSPAALGVSVDTRALGLSLQTLRLDSIAYSLGKTVDFRKGGNGLPFEGDGWGNPELEGSWTLGARSVLELQLPEPPKDDLLLSIEAHAFTPPQRRHFAETLMVNGHAAAEWSLSDRESVIGRRVRLPAGLIRSRLVHIEFINHDPRSPVELGVSGDTRLIGLALQTLRLDMATHPTQP